MSNVWNQQFRLRILALMLERAWWNRHHDVIKPQFFENEAEMVVADLFLTFYDEYNRPPDQDEFETYANPHFTKQRLSEAVIQEVLDVSSQVYAGADSWDLDYARDNVIEFARIQALKVAFLQAIDKIEDGDIDDIDSDISRALLVGQEQFESIRLKADVNTWLYRLATEDKIPTGLFHCDAMLEGGGGRGEVGVIVSPPNVGKTMSLVNIGFGASGFGSNANVAHVTLEVSKEKISKRYAARTTFQWYTKKLNVEDYKAKFLRAADMRIRGDIDIMGAAPGVVSVNDLRRHLDRLGRDGFLPDCLIVDYADEMKLPRGDNSFERHGENYRMLKTLAIDYNILIWTASQSNRASLRKLTIDLDDMAESFQKAARADIVLAWCQTPEEEDDGMMRWFCAKNRDGFKHWYVRCKVHDYAHALTTQEILWGSDLIREKTNRYD